jgi:hypothetical protein
LVRLSSVALAVVGCQQPTGTFVAEQAGPRHITTASVDAARAASVERRVIQREHTAREVRARGGAVTHTPLYFEDPFEEPDARVDAVAWSGSDYACLLYGPGRFLVNTALFPISAIATPPWMLVTSDATVEKAPFLEDVPAAQPAASAN